MECENASAYHSLFGGRGSLCCWLYLSDNISKSHGKPRHTRRLFGRGTRSGRCHIFRFFLVVYNRYGLYFQSCRGYSFVFSESIRQERQNTCAGVFGHSYRLALQGGSELYKARGRSYKSAPLYNLLADGLDCRREKQRGRLYILANAHRLYAADAFALENEHSISWRCRGPNNGRKRRAAPLCKFARGNFADGGGSFGFGFNRLGRSCYTSYDAPLGRG